MSFIAVAIGATVVAGGLSAYGSYKQGQAQKDMYNYQAQAALMKQEQTKKAAEANVTSSQNQAAMKSRMLARKASEIQGAQAAAGGAQGIGSSVTAADIAKDTFTKQELDQQTLMYNANVKAWNITNESNAAEWELGVESNLDRVAAKNAATAGNINAASTLLSTAGQAAGYKYMSAK